MGECASAWDTPVGGGGIEPSVLTLRFIFLHRSIKSSNAPSDPPKSLLSMLIPAGLNTSDGNEWFHFLGNSRPSWDAFSRGKGYSAAVGLSFNYELVASSCGG
jgi:hypothetical protein